MYKNMAEIPVQGVNRRRPRKNYFSSKDRKKIDYKDVRLLEKCVSERGKIIPRRISGISSKKQRELAAAIKLARFLALMPFIKQ